MTKLPIMDPVTGHVLDGAAFDSPNGRFAIHPCAHECAGVIVGQTSRTGTAVIHYAAHEALEIGLALVELAKKALG